MIFAFVFVLFACCGQNPWRGSRAPIAQQALLAIPTLISLDNSSILSTFAMSNP